MLELLEKQGGGQHPGSQEERREGSEDVDRGVDEVRSRHHVKDFELSSKCHDPLEGSE